MEFDNQLERSHRNCASEETNKIKSKFIVVRFSLWILKQILDLIAVKLKCKQWVWLNIDNYGENIIEICI